jgi:hypothetical protein
MKLYATLETSQGKLVSVSDNSEIIATVYDGNKKAYSVIIEWTNVGDPEHDPSTCENSVPCYDCDHPPKPTMGAIVTVREWRNQPDSKRKAHAQR